MTCLEKGDRFLSKKRKKKGWKIPPFLTPLLHGFEHFTDKIIPYLLIALAILLILENPFWTLVHLEEYEPGITIFDYTIVTFFVVDLIFKWFKVRRVGTFLKMYWLDIIAVFPFFFFFRLYLRLGTLLRIGEGISEAQKVAHEAVLIREVSLIREVELAKETRLLKETRPLIRLLRVVQRFLRVLKGRFVVGKEIAKRLPEPAKK